MRLTSYLSTPIGDGLQLHEEKIQNYWYASIRRGERDLMIGMSVYPLAAVNEVLACVALTEKNRATIRQILNERTNRH